jgi:hypothetical protein
MKEILCYGYNNRDKRKLKVAMWIATKVLYCIYIEKKTLIKNNCGQI